LRRVIRLENYLGIRSEFETEDFKSYWFRWTVR
jgi:hypothetical protein